jgi:RNA polymerase sigma-70 factor (ECF subfamily)
MGTEYDIAIKKGFSKSDLDDVLVIEKIKAGNSNAFGKIYDKYYNYILRKMTFLCNGDVEKAEDLTSEVMIKASKVIGKYSVEGGSGKFVSWINRVAKNTFIDKTRSVKSKFIENLISIDKKIDLGESEVVGIQVKDDVLNVEERIIKQENDVSINDKLKKAISELSEIEQKIIDLRIFCGLEFNEIAEEIGKSQNYCLVKFHRTKEKLKNKLS